MMTSAQIRQSFLDFFKSKQHTIVPSSSLMPDSPNLLFTNAGMNQFVPIFLGQTKCPYTPGRAADTQKCIRAGGKHNDLEDVGLDTYHHTFFEMLGNWSFGDYFKKEAIEWAWELVTSKKWFGFPPERLYATVYKPGPGEPSEFDQEAYDQWEKLFKAAGLDPKVHVCYGGKKDNFWMMGDTGPCGPCSEIHVDLTPAGDTGGKLVNAGSPECIEIWNLVFIQFNANPDGTFSPLPAKHVDTGMGFERVTSIIQCTKNFTDFGGIISNYETDIFRPIFDKLEELSGKKYGSTLPNVGPASRLPSERVSASDSLAPLGGAGETPALPLPNDQQIQVDIAFRVIADHIRTLSFAIADGIQPGIKGRNGVLRSIHKRMLRYASRIDLADELLIKTQDALVDTLAQTMGDVFPNVRTEKEHIKKVLRSEAEVFSRTFNQGVNHFSMVIKFMEGIDLRYQICGKPDAALELGNLFMREGPYTNTYFETVGANSKQREFGEAFNEFIKTKNPHFIVKMQSLHPDLKGGFSGDAAFLLSDTYGFPLDLTEVMARECGLTVDKDGFNRLLDEQKKRSQAAQKKEVISLSQIETTTPTKFVGFDKLETPAKVLEVVRLKDKTAVILDESACYAEMGGQVGDTGEIVPVLDVVWPSSEKGADSRPRLRITNTQKSGNTWLHFVDGESIPAIGDEVFLRVEAPRRNAIQRHHTVTHLLHWALHEVVSKEASQKGSFVGPDKLTFDFNSAPLTPQQVADVEKLVNERILENAPVTWLELPYAEVKKNTAIVQFFGEKYGDTVRVLQIGGERGKLNGYSMELCGGTHTRATGEIGLFRIVGENAIAAGVRRIEAVAGLEAYRKATDEVALIKLLAGKVNSPVHELEKKIESLLEHQKAMEKQAKIAQQREASNAASNLLEEIKTINGVPAIIHNLGSADGDFLQSIADSLKGRFQGVMVLGGVANGMVALIAAVSPDFTAKVQAGKIIQQIAPIVGGKGGGKPDNARGGGKDAGKLDEALAKARENLKG